ncbi:MAG TPA: site-2 protease family protein [Verrucomicrobiae bacterium]|nr:site-2 protease family protein [Verrucomicrobiae bacterium]
MQQQSKIKFDVKLPLILIHTPYGIKFFDRIAKTSAAKFYARFTTYLMPIITAVALFLIIGGIVVLFSNSIAREGVRGIGPQSNLLIPGLNPYLPIADGWIALIITIIIHEAGHGVVARVYGAKVESTGIVLLLILPIGAFVNIERDEMEKLSIKQKSSVMTAGPMSNIILAFVSLLCIFIITSTLTVAQPSNPNVFGVSITSVGSKTLAESLGLVKGSIIQQIQNKNIKTTNELNGNLSANLGNMISISWLNDKGEKITKQTTLPKERTPGKGILGVTIIEISDPKKVLNTYDSLFTTNPLALLAPPTIAQGSVPFSSMMQDKYSSPILGSYFPVVENFLFWIWFINFNVAIFNALPIGPLDGGQLYNTIIDKKTEGKKGILRHASKILTYGTIIVVALAFVVPWLLR